MKTPQTPKGALRENICKNLQVSGKLLIFAMHNIHINSWAKNQQSFLNRINGKPTMVAAWKLSAVTYAQRMDVMHTYGGLLLFVIILTTMHKVMNLDELISNEVAFTDFQFLTLMEKGGVR